jgi:hypothetical protein
MSCGLGRYELERARKEIERMDVLGAERADATRKAKSMSTVEKSRIWTN